jgi:hypothetical protein
MQDILGTFTYHSSLHLRHIPPQRLTLFTFINQVTDLAVLVVTLQLDSQKAGKAPGSEL